MAAERLNGRPAAPPSKRYPLVSTLGAEDRVRVVSDIFATLHARYDFLNRFLSVRRDVAGRRAAVRRMRFHHTHALLDVAAGTADLSLEAARSHPAISITGVDFSPRMLEVGRVKLRRRGLEGRVTLREADALHLPFPDSSFDVAAIAFGMRNIPDMQRALREMTRVTVPGGQVMVLEMTFAPAPLLRGVYRAYLTRILPVIAAPFTANAAAYSYLQDSILHFPSPAALAARMREAGLTETRYHALSNGIAYLHVGKKPAGIVQAGKSPAFQVTRRDCRWT
jgi:demethylmenaquinone methyltransferase/2-methoxy-6-polyprenyl-1,4-benzoquinol methylase